ncbi:unnamed protein product, partial [marine sediment metagenome]
MGKIVGLTEKLIANREKKSRLVKITRNLVGEERVSVSNGQIIRVYR